MIALAFHLSQRSGPNYAGDPPTAPLLPPSLAQLIPTKFGHASLSGFTLHGDVAKPGGSIKTYSTTPVYAPQRERSSTAYHLSPLANAAMPLTAEQVFAYLKEPRPLANFNGGCPPHGQYNEAAPSVTVLVQRAPFALVTVLNWATPLYLFGVLHENIEGDYGYAAIVLTDAADYGRRLGAELPSEHAPLVLTGPPPDPVTGGYSSYTFNTSRLMARWARGSRGVDRASAYLTLNALLNKLASSSQPD